MTKQTKPINNTEVKAHLTKLRAFDKKLDKVTTDFSELVTNSVNLLWNHGQIAVINKTMDTLTHLRGADMRALSTYYAQCIPYTFDGDTGRFTKKNKKTEESMIDTYADFIAENQWYDFSMVKTAKPYELNIDKMLTVISKHLEKGEAEGHQVTNAKLEQLATGMNDIIEQFAKSEDDGVSEIVENNQVIETAGDLDIELKDMLLKEA